MSLIEIKHELEDFIDEPHEREFQFERFFVSFRIESQRIRLPHSQWLSILLHSIFNERSECATIFNQLKQNAVVYFDNRMQF